MRMEINKAPTHSLSLTAWVGLFLIVCGYFSFSLPQKLFKTLLSQTKTIRYCKLGNIVNFNLVAIAHKETA
jgi:hypothetical protein